MREQLNLPNGVHGDLWFRYLHGFTMPSHKHDELEVNLVMSGTASYVVDGRRYRMVADDMIWLFPDQGHVLVDISPDFSMWILVIHPFALRPHCRQAKWAPLLAGNPLGSRCRRLTSVGVQQLDAAFKTFSQHLAEPVVANAQLVYLTLTAWHQFDQAGDSVASTALHPAVARAVTMLVAGEDDVSLDTQSLNDLAQQCDMSYSRLARIFKQAVGETLVEFRNRCRLQRFIARVQHLDDQTLASHAEACGFGSYAQFHRIFIQQLCCGPRQWLQQQVDKGKELVDASN